MDGRINLGLFKGNNKCKSIFQKAEVNGITLPFENWAYKAVWVESDNSQIKWPNMYDRDHLMGRSADESLPQQDENLLVSWGFSQLRTNFPKQ